jgi:hypothetical protein
MLICGEVTYIPILRGMSVKKLKSLLLLWFVLNTISTLLAFTILNFNIVKVFLFIEIIQILYYNIYRYVFYQRV